jgi:transposase
VEVDGSSEHCEEDLMNGHDDNKAPVDCYVALELSRAKWLVGALLPGSENVATTPVTGGDTDKLLAALDRIAMKASDAGYVNVRLRVCFEAGYDGFWLARFLIDRGIDTNVLDASSFLVSRRGRRAKTDRVDVESMAFVLKAFLLGDRSVCRPVRIPSPDEEDAKRIARERAQLLKERTRNVNRIRALLNLQGIREVRGLWGGKWQEWLAHTRTGDGRLLGPFLLRELGRHFERLELLASQLKALEGERAALIAQETKIPAVRKIVALTQLRGIGEGGATTLVTEVFHRQFKNRRHLASYLGLAPSHYASGEVSRDQGISKAGNKSARVMMVELAWCWLRYQPQSQLTQWYRCRFAEKAGRSRKVGVIALARKLAIALWRFLEHGIVPDGANLKPV